MEHGKAQPPVNKELLKPAKKSIEKIEELYAPAILTIMCDDGKSNIDKYNQLLKVLHLALVEARK